MSLWAQWSLGELNFSGFWMWVFPKIGILPQNGWFIMENLIKMGWFGLKTHYFRKHLCFWVFLLSIQSMPAKIHWSVGNALAHFSGRDSPQNPSCSGEINWASGLQNLCNNSNKHLGGETSKSFFCLEFGIHPWKKKKLWGRLIIYISNEFEVASIFSSSWCWLKKNSNNSKQESSLRGEPASAVRYQVEDQGWAEDLRCTDPAEDDRRKRWSSDAGGCWWS